MNLGEFGVIAVVVEDDFTFFSYGLVQHSNGMLISEKYLKPKKVKRFASSNNYYDYISDFELEETLRRTFDFIYDCSERNWRIDVVGISILGKLKSDYVVKNFFELDTNFRKSAKEIKKWFNKELAEKLPKLGNIPIHVLENAIAATFLETQIYPKNAPSESLIYINLGREVCGGRIRRINDEHSLVSGIGNSLLNFKSELDDNSLMEKFDKCEDGISTVYGVIHLISLNALRNRLKTMNKLEVTEIYANYLANLCVDLYMVGFVSKFIFGGYIFETNIVDTDKLIEMLEIKFRILISEDFRFARLNRMYGSVSFDKVDVAFCKSRYGTFSNSRGLIEFLKARYLQDKFSKSLTK